MVREGMVRDRFVREYDWDAVSPSFGVIDAIARYEGVETSRFATELTPALEDSFDTEALDALISQEAELSVTFDHADYRVELDADSVTITNLPQTTP